MKKLVYLPLDERPCNARFAPMLFDGGDVHVVTPDVLGTKKTPADTAQLAAFLMDACRDADGLVLSMDMLLYGGLIPSRLHHLRAEEVQHRLSLVRTLKMKYPQLSIYAYQCIMRCPSYSSDDEEPDYYGLYGADIFLLGQAEHRQSLGLPCQPPEELRQKIPAVCLEDFLNRRAFNRQRNLETLALVEDGTIDFLIFPQDDSAPYGYTAMDQKIVRAAISEKKLWFKVYMYPGADEVGMTLTSRMALHFAGRRPSVYVTWASCRGMQVVPRYEDRPVGETVKYQLLAAGLSLATSVSEADFVLAINSPSDRMGESDEQPILIKEYTTERTLTAFALEILRLLEAGKVVTVGDIAYTNGSDRELVALLDALGVLPRLHGYAGWNTSSNTLGTAIAMGVQALLAGCVNRDFMALRLVEDVGYCASVRPGDFSDEKELLGAIHRRLEAFVREQLPSVANHICIDDVWQPWNRMFEIGINVRWVE